MKELLEVCEIFYSIQGESRRSGIPCVFIRLAGCPLDCTWCDTRYARDGSVEYKAMSIADIIDQVESYKCDVVELTGGEPLAQPASYDLLAALCDMDMTVLLETSGAYTLAGVDHCVTKIMDIKCPSSGMSDRMDFKNIELLHSRDEVKFVVADRADFDYALRIISQYRLTSRCTVNFSPVADKLEASELADWILNDCPGGRLNLQLHRLIWPDRHRGV